MRPTGLKAYDKRTKRATFEAITPGTHGRKRKRKVVTVAGWDDLLKKLKAFRDSVQHPAQTAAVPTLREYVTGAWENIASRLGADKRLGQESFLKHHILPALGDVPLDAFTRAHLEDFVTVMLRKRHGATKRPYSNATINTLIHLVRRILKHAWRRRITDYPLREPLPLLPEPTVHNELSPIERDRFLAAFNDEAGFRRLYEDKVSERIDPERRSPGAHSDAVTYAFERFQWSKPLFTLALHTGLRRTDLRLLRWTSVEDAVIRVVMRKTKRLVTIPISDKAADAIAACRKVCEYVITTPDGRPYSEATITRYFTIAKAIAGITRHVRLHDLRHTFGSTLASRGINTFTLRDLLGHTSTRTTERYARPSSEALDAVKKALAT